MNRHPWVLGFTIYGALVCSWFAYVSYYGSPGPLTSMSQRAYGRSGAGVYHK